MLFNTLEFFLFFVAFYALFAFVAVTRSQRLWLIICSSLFFYGNWNYKFVPLLLGTGLGDFYIAQAIAREQRRSRQRGLLVLSIAMNLGVLSIFKYANFILQNVGALLHAVHVQVTMPALSIVLPIGISFYTFQSISYTVDVYRGTLRARKRFQEFLAALTFFPHLVAGPIVRASFILPQFERFAVPTWEMCKRGLLLVAFGLSKKTIADLLGRVVENVFDAQGAHGALESWTGALAFTGQVYGDFAGYTDIAIGVALLIGFQLPANFELPYLATSPVQFWHRWHISLSTWLRDYLWLPLSVAYPTRPALALIVTMLLGGLWHGANWTFVAWGLYHGVLLVVTHALTRGRRANTPVASVVRVGLIALTFYLVTVGWVLFRASTLTSALSLLRAMHLGGVPSEMSRDAISMVALVIAGIVSCHALDWCALRKAAAFERGWLLWPTLVVCTALCLLFGGSGAAFIYFQF